MKRCTIEAEMAKREQVDEKTYEMIGTELKRIRQSQSQTLSSVADDICSVSYLCKIENAQLKPNRYMLHQICKKLQLDEPKIDILFDLKKNLLELVECFYQKNTKRIFELYSECHEFDNYRSKLMCFIYYLYTYEIESADVVSKALLKLTGVMKSDELAIFMTFYSILCYYQENYLEAVDNLKYIEKQLYFDALVRIAKHQLFLCYCKLNHPFTLIYGKELQDFYYQNSKFKKAESVKYLMSLYQLHNGMMEVAERNIECLQNESYRNTLRFLCDCNKRKLKKGNDYHHLRPFAQLLHTYIFDKKNYLNAFLKLDKVQCMDCDFSYNFANYLTMGNDEEKFYELENVIIPNLYVTNNQFEIKIFLQELCDISAKVGRYKYFCKVFSDLSGGKINL